jgi:mRNA interferase RelE/StbE
VIWTIEYAKSVQKSVRKLDHQTQTRLRKYLETRLAVAKDPRSLGRPLQGSQFQNLWRFRVGDYRIIAQIEDDKVRILVLRIGHRREIYR